MWCVPTSSYPYLPDLLSIGPVAHYHENSKYYSAIKPRAAKAVDERLPHITIQMPVFKESLHAVLAPSIESLKKAMQTYARQGGTSSIFVNDDGLRLLPGPDRDERLAYYAHHNIGWVARPRHDDAKDGFQRAGRFKKASNMNYALALSLKMERHLERLVQAAGLGAPPAVGDDAGTRSGNWNGNGTGSVQHPAQGLPHRMSVTSGGFGPDARSYAGARQYGLQYQNREGDDMAVINSAGSAVFNNAVPFGEADSVIVGIGEDLEERALAMAIGEVFAESGGRFRPWAANGKACRLGEYILIVDSDTVVPEDCLRDAAREMAECPTVVRVFLVLWYSVLSGI